MVKIIPLKIVILWINYNPIRLMSNGSRGKFLLWIKTTIKKKHWSTRATKQTFRIFSLAKFWKFCVYFFQIENILLCGCNSSEFALTVVIASATNAMNDCTEHKNRIDVYWTH